MKIRKTVHDTHAILVLQGDFETDDASALLQAIEGLREEGVHRIAVSLRMVKYINSTALGSLVRARELMRLEGGDIVIVKPSAMTREIISKMGLDAVIPMIDDEDDAVDHLLEGDLDEFTTHDDAEDGLDPTVVLFSFGDDRAQLIKGRTRNGVGKIQSVNQDEVTFTWDSSRHEASDSDVNRMFGTGSEIALKFQLKLARKDRFGVQAQCLRYAVDDGRKVTVSARWSGISAEDRAALSRFTQDMAYLQQQISDEA